jgi:hypothetical protein
VPSSTRGDACNLEHFRLSRDVRTLIDAETQQAIADQIDLAIEEVLAKLRNHGGEEGITPVLGHALMQRSFSAAGLTVAFNYRQLSKHIEEPYAGADGGFLVRVSTKTETVTKASLFQAKLLSGDFPPRSLTMNRSEMTRLYDQTRNMLKHSEQSVAMFYTERNIYVVDAAKYSSGPPSRSQQPLGRDKRLITLGTYLGKWMPRCTKGDRSANLVSRIEHLEGFRNGIDMAVVTERRSIDW